MKDNESIAPVVLILFNRPEPTKRVLAEIAKAKPAKLFIIADGPRQTHPTDTANCAAAREVVENIDWDCDLFRNYSEDNLGCKRRVSSGLTWVFEQVEGAIILEDDCVPHPSFFPYCTELLARFRDDDRVALISGNNFLDSKQPAQYSYYFSLFPHIWGWASWRRAWRHYDGEITNWPELRQTTWLENLLGNKIAGQYWQKIFDRVKAGEIDSWAYPWTYSCWVQSMLSISPAKNLVTNVGFGAEATHTKNVRSPDSNLPIYAQSFPLRHPPYIVRDYSADLMTLSNRRMIKTKGPILKRIYGWGYQRLPQRVQQSVLRMRRGYTSP